MHIYVEHIVAIKPNLIRVTVNLDTEDTSVPVSLVRNELVVNTSDFIVEQEEDGAVNVSLDVDKFKQLVTDECFRMLTTSYTAAILSKQSLDWEVIQTQPQTNEDTDGLNLAYGEENK